MDGRTYQYAEDKAGRFATLLSGVLGHRLIGFYLVGSFSFGDLQPDSDLDFIAALSGTDDLSDGEPIRFLHEDAFTENDGHALEGFYVAVDDLRRHPSESASPRLQWLDGKLRLASGGLLVEWEMLRRIGHRIHGSPVVDLRVFDASDDLAAFSRRNLQEYWARWIERTGPYFMQNGSRRDRAWAGGWCVLGVPRLYTAIAEGEIVSKTEAGVRARATFDSRWHALIDAALEHRRRNDEASTEAMIEVAADALPFASHVLGAALALR